LKDSPSITNRGFTLLEIILATSLTSLLLLIVYTTYFSINRSIDAASEEQEVLQSGRVLLELIRQDLRGVYPAKNFQFLSEIADKEKDESEITHTLDFVTTSSMGSNVFGRSVVGYYLITTDEEVKVFIRRESKEIKLDIKEGGVNFELSRLVKQFRLSFYDGQEWVEEWDSKARGKLPVQVRIVLVLVNEKGNERTFTADEAIPSAT
jgi:type II secretion system protein J